MPPVRVIILHREPAPEAPPLEWLLATSRLVTGDRHVRGFAAAGAADVRVVAGPPDERSFGTRLAELLGSGDRGPFGAVVLGAGSIPLARTADLRRFVAAAGADEPRALANNAYSADIVAIARADRLPPIPPLPADNALPRWLAEVAGWRVRDLRDRWRLQVDLDSPLDVVLTAATTAFAGRAATVTGRLAAVAARLADRRAEVVVAGRTNGRTVRWLERRSAARIRALVEERGLRASSPLALGPSAGDGGVARGRPPRSTLGLLLDRDGPGAIGRLLAELGDAALVDTRVLLAHRLGPDESGWPTAEDRYASDLLDDRSVGDPWLRDLTAAAREAPIPVVLGGHTLVGPGVRLVAGWGLRERGADRTDPDGRTVA